MQHLDRAPDQVAQDRRVARDLALDQLRSDREGDCLLYTSDAADEFRTV
ncbi:MAG: hypothetical protein QUU85_18105 [Candidatus Eisenbacteria bacterium]|nr:hypothetical protein [Candidatus Eisenbacteria bacterium]